jgi:group II intron reverse transcriptase/maturase
VNDAAQRSRQTRFTALLHHVDVEALLRSFRRQRRRAATGIDGVTVEEYARNLKSNIKDLCDRLHSGRYRPQAVRRTHLPKPDGGLRPIGVLVLEDKIVQGAVAEVLSAVYEADFIGFSYGFRPGRSPHVALKALERALITRKINWVLDADIRSFFDSVDHEWMLRMVAHRIADPRILRLIKRWLRAGILEGGEWMETVAGTPQGAGISPLLANIFLHYVFDLWVAKWRRGQARGDMIVIRYADDTLFGFEHEKDARRMQSELSDRFGKFGLRLHEEKTRLIEFGRYAAERRAKRGERRPETFDFLGFTHCSSRTKDGRFIIRRKTQRKRMVRKLKELRIEAKRRRHWLMGKQQKWLAAVLRGHYAYYGLPGNIRALSLFAYEVRKLWFGALCRRSQKSRMTWERFNRLPSVFPLPSPTTRSLRDWLA